ncbi:MAG: hypothetical protein IB616_03300 [Methanosarcinales archaeon]|nr:MAG: hypothetical protein IB616_03300 [Methanosarcinales archaeon]
MVFKLIREIVKGNIELQELSGDIRDMYKTSREMYKDVWIAILTRDKDLAQKALKRDDEVNATEVKIRENSLKYVATSMIPVDVTIAFSMIDLASILESMADYVCVLAKMCIGGRVKYEKGEKYSKLLEKADQIIADMFDNALIALEKEDRKRAKKALKQYEDVLSLQKKLMEKIDDDKKIEPSRAGGLVMAMNSFARIGRKLSLVAGSVLKPYPMLRH